jgi:hypothetical protein
LVDRASDIGKLVDVSFKHKEELYSSFKLLNFFGMTDGHTINDCFTLCQIFDSKMNYSLIYPKENSIALSIP